MTSMNRINYLSFDEYFDMMKTLVNETYQGLEQADARRQIEPDKYEVIESLLLRSAGLLECIFVLSPLGYQRNALALYRMLVERAWYLLRIVRRSEYTAFKYWSIAVQYNDLDQLYGLQDVRAKINPEWIAVSKRAQAERRRLFGMKPPGNPEGYWEPPNLKELAQEHGLFALYVIAYAYPSSTAVHPTHDEGRETETDKMLIYHNAIAAYSLAASIGLAPLDVPVPRSFFDITDKIVATSPDDSQDEQVRHHMDAIRRQRELYDDGFGIQRGVLV